jgi:hypothetical protein
MRNFARLVVYALLAVGGLWLLLDATTYALYAADPSTGRPRGCYTTMERAFGLQPSEGGILSGTRLYELSFGLAALLYGTFGFVRRLWRSPFEVPLVGAVAAWGIWLEGEALFWRFHDADVYFTWRIIRNTPNELAAKITAGAVLILNALLTAGILTVLRRRNVAVLPRLRRAAYSGLSTYAAAIVLTLCTFPNLTLVLLFAAATLFVSVLVLAAHVRSAAYFTT